MSFLTALMIFLPLYLVVGVAYARLDINKQIRKIDRNRARLRELIAEKTELDKTTSIPDNPDARVYRHGQHARLTFLNYEIANRHQLTTEPQVPEALWHGLIWPYFVLLWVLHQAYRPLHWFLTGGVRKQERLKEERQRREEEERQIAAFLREQAERLGEGELKDYYLEQAESLEKRTR